MISGWSVMLACNYELDTDRKLNIISEVTEQLLKIDQAVPSPALQAIRDTIFWVEYPFTEDTDAAYHPSREWLLENGFNPDKAGGIELDYNIYLWREEQPWAMFHELSHAYHDKVLVDNNEAVLRAFNTAVASGRYEQVKHITGEVNRAYALNDEFEYFAEISEAYFGVNDFQPFNRDELWLFDSAGYALVESMWLSRKQK